MAITINGTTGISGVDGSSATPALQGADTNTGISFGTDTVTINTGGVARVTTDASGNVGIGTSSPGSKLHVRTSAGYNIYFETSGTSLRLNYLNDAGSANVSATYRATDFAWQKGDGSQTVCIDSSGNLLVGTTSTFGVGVTVLPSGQVFCSRSGDVSGVFDRRDSDGQVVHFRRQGNTVGSVSVTTTATSYNTSSDYRLKEQVAPMTGALAKNELLNPVTYKWKVDGSDGQGFIAHELQAIFPDAVAGEKDAVDDEGKPVYQGVDTSFLVGHLVACVKELKAELDSVKAELATLKGAA